MKRYFLSSGALVLTFVIGVYANVVALRAAYRFIPDVNSQSTVPPALPQISERRPTRQWIDPENLLRNLPKHLAKKLPKDGRVIVRFSASDPKELIVFVDDENRSFRIRQP